MERNYLTDTSLTCAALVCSIGISLSFPSWSSLDGVAWNWGCLLLIVSCLTIVLTFHRIFCLHKKSSSFLKENLLGAFYSVVCMFTSIIEESVFMILLNS